MRLRTLVGWIIAASFALLPACQTVHGASGQPEKVSIATGAEGGYYQNLCVAIQAVAKERDLVVHCKTSEGSQDNIYRLDQNEADFALVQSDVAHRAWRGEYPFEEDHPGIQLVAPLFTEKVHVLVRPHQYMTSLTQLKGKRIFLGGKNSGSRFSAVAVMMAAGMTYEDLRKTAKSMDRQEALALIRANHKSPVLDAVIDSKVSNTLALSAMLQSLGIKRFDVAAGTHRAAILVRPDLEINNPSELSTRNVVMGEGCSEPQATALAIAGLVAHAPDPRNQESPLAQLRGRKIDALIEPAELSPKLVADILWAHGNRILSLGPDPRTHGKDDLEVLLRPGLDISSPSQLAGKKLWWPQENEEFDHVITSRILGEGAAGEVNGHSPKVQAVRDIDANTALELLKLGELDAVFQVTVAPSPNLADVVSKYTEISLMGIDWPMVEKLVQDGSYVETSLQPYEYPDLDQGIYTVGVQTLLLTRLGDSSDEDKRRVALVAQLLNDEQARIERQLGEMQRQNAQASAGAGTQSVVKAATPNVLTLLGSPVKPQLTRFIHQSAKPFLVITGIRRGALWEVLLLLVAVVIVCGIALIMEWGRQFAAYYPARALFVVGCVLVWAIGAVWMQAVEGDVNQDFVSVHNAAFSLGLNVIHHFGLPVEPPAATTRQGQFAMEVFSWLGVLLVGAFCLPFVKWLWTDVIKVRLERWREPRILSIGANAERPPDKAA